MSHPSNEESSSRYSRRIPILESGAGYINWSHLMRNYLIEKKLEQVLIMQITRWTEMSAAADSYTMKETSAALAKFGVCTASSVRVPTVKKEITAAAVSESSPLTAPSDAEMKIVVETVLKIRSVYSILFESIPVEYRNQIPSEQRGNGAYLWKWLEEKLQSNTVDTQHIIMSELFAIHQSDDETFEQYKARVDHLNDRLTQAKVDIPLPMYRHILLGKLRAEYQPIVVTISTSSEYKSDTDPVKEWNKITQAIATFERQFLSQNGSSASSSTVMALQATIKKKFDKKYIKCYNCNKMGHYKSECSAPLRVSDTPNETTPAVAHSAQSVSNSMSSSNSSSSSSQYMFTAVAVEPRKLYSAVVCASIRSPGDRNKLKVASAATSEKSPKKLIHPRDSAEVTVKSPSATPSVVKIPDITRPSPPLAQNSSTAQTVVRPVQKDSTVRTSPPILKQKKPIEQRLKLMTWGLDTMASIHCSGNKEMFATRHRCTPMRILCANNESIIVNQIGTVKLRVRTEEGNIVPIVIKDVYYSENVGANLLSCMKLLKEHNFSIDLTPGASVLVSSRGTRVPLTAKGNLLTLEGDAPAVVYSAISNGLTIGSVQQLVDTHARLGHMGFDRLIDTLKSGKTRGVGKLNLNSADIAEARSIVMQCKACSEGKHTKPSHSGNATLNHGSAPGEVLHFDTFEVRHPEKPTQYAVVITEPYSGALWCTRIMSKDKAAAVVIASIAGTNTATGNKVKLLYTDGGTEFINQTLKSYCQKHGIRLHYPPPKTPEWNGIAERTVRTIKDGARTLLCQAGLSNDFWYQAVTHYLYVWNRTYISRYTHTTPFETYYKQEASLSTVSVFGCDVNVWIHKSNRESGPFAPRGEPGVYLGHDPTQNCPIVWLLRSQKEIRTRNVDYRETEFNYSRAIKAGPTAVQHALSDSEDGGSLRWSNQDQNDASAVAPPSDQNATEESLSASDDIESEAEYEIERIVSHRSTQRDSADGRDYKVKWVGYKQQTWEPVGSLRGSADEALQQYCDDKGLNADASDDSLSAGHNSGVTVMSDRQ